jgi:putative glutamine amidotransferase
LQGTSADAKHVVPAMSAPRIAITTYGTNEDGRYTLPAKYVDAVRRAGGLPYLLAPGEPRLAEWIQTIDGIVLTGGPDVDPLAYGGEPHPTIYGVDRVRDESDFELVRAIVESKTPALCICRGAQVLNVGLGGTLVEHLPDEVGESVQHRGPNREYVPHLVHVAGGTRLSRILGQRDVSPASSHHQAIREVGRGLAVVAKAPDGTIEAVEMPDHPWLVAVQWHPEYTAAEDSVQQRLFDALVEASRHPRSTR